LIDCADEIPSEHVVKIRDRATTNSAIMKEDDGFIERVNQFLQKHGAEPIRLRQENMDEIPF